MMFIFSPVIACSAHCAIHVTPLLGSARISVTGVVQKKIAICKPCDYCRFRQTPVLPSTPGSAVFSPLRAIYTAEDLAVAVAPRNRLLVRFPLICPLCEQKANDGFVFSTVENSTAADSPTT